MTLATALLACLGSAPPIDDPRQRLAIEAWRFRLGDVPDAARIDFDDSGWEVVRTPHTWNARDGQDGGNDYHRGAGWYRGPLRLPADRDDRRFFLRFNAASLVADVHLDGRLIGQHHGGFAAFCYEITPHVRAAPADDSVALAVRVSNAAHPDVAPLSGDFTVFGGLYRPVELLITNAICISPLDHASAGVYLMHTTLTDANAIIAARVLVSNGRAAAADVDVVCTMLDRDRKPVASAVVTVAVPAGATVPAALRVTIAKPRRWHGRDDPYLYTARVELHAAGNIVDRVEQPLGLRTFHVDPERGFFLNDRPYPLYGVNRHQDRLDQGWAISPADMEEDFTIISELGCTAVRLAHYQHDDYAYTLADRAGLIVWAEIPLIDAIADSAAFRANCRQQLLELIRQNYNHPAICFWGIHNEVTAPWRPGPDPTALVRELHELAKAEDPQRLTAAAACDPQDHPANWQTDLTAFNRYFGWYVGEPTDFGPWADRLHAARPRSPLGVSEFGAGGSIRQQAWPPVKPVHNGPFHPEAWQAHLHREHWRAMRERPYLWCNLVWNGFDFASDGRNEGDTRGRNDKGLVTYDRRVRKEAYLAYQAMWSSAPVVKIACRSGGPGGPLRIYTNCDAVTLFIDGVEHGTRPMQDYVVEWSDLPLRDGSHELRVLGRCSVTTVEDRCAWRPLATSVPSGR